MPAQHIFNPEVKMLLIFIKKVFFREISVRILPLIIDDKPIATIDTMTESPERENKDSNFRSFSFKILI